MSSVLEQLFHFGALGPVVAICALYIWRLHKALREESERRHQAEERRAALEELRVREAREVAERIVEVNNKWLDRLRSKEEALKVVNEALFHMREALKELRETILWRRTNSHE